MNGFFKSSLLSVVFFALGSAATRYYDIHRMTSATKPATDAVINFALEPLWAYGFDKPPAPGDKAQPQTPPNRNLRPNEDPGEQTRLRNVEGSPAAYSLVDIRDGQNVIDWFPQDHPPLPAVVVHGPARLDKAKRGCGSCHLPNGKGRPENAGVAGLPVPYFMRQIQDFRSGKRHSADPRKPNTNTMIDLAKALTDDELKTAAEYFGSMQWSAWIRVVETDFVPKTRIAGNLFLPLSTDKTEPVGPRIVEMPENEEQAETYRNPHSGFVAYVPPGSLERGKDLVTTGGARMVGNEFVAGKTTPCITCHGVDLMGVTDIPPIAGRSPSYIARQMWDMQQGARNGQAAQLMKFVITNLAPEDILAIAAYVASRPPVNGVPLK